MKNKNRLFNFTIFGSLQYVVLTCVAMYFYAGGTKIDRNNEGYLFTQNFLSDLGRTVVYNGEENTISAIIYLITLGTAGLSLIIFFNSIIHLFPVKYKIPISRISIRIIGTFSGLGFIGIALSPSDWDYRLHIQFVVVAFISLLIAAIFLMANIYTTKSFRNIFGHTLLGTIILLFFYILLMLFGPKPWESLNGLIIQATGQKIMVYTMLLSLGFVAWGARNIPPSISNIELEE